MPDLTALDRFLEARPAMAERASSRAGLETCHELSDALDAGLTQLAERSAALLEDPAILKSAKALGERADDVGREGRPLTSSFPRGARGVNDH